MPPSLSRAAVDLLWFALLVGLPVCVAWRQAGWFVRTAEQDERTLWTALLAMTHLTALALALSPWHLLNRPAAALINVSLALLLAFARPPVPGSGESGVRSPESGASSGGMNRALAAYTAVFLALSCIRGAMVPPLELDTLTYHLPRTVEWLQEETLFTEFYPGGEERVEWSFTGYFPGNAELPGFWLMLPFRSDLLVNLVNTLFIVLGAIALRRAVQVWGGARDLADLAAWSYLYLPLHWRDLQHTGWIEPVWMFYLLAALGFLRAPAGRESPSAVDLGFALAIGLLAGSKSSGPFLAGVLVLFVPRPRGRRLALSLAAAALFAGPWFLRVALQTGSPFYPVVLKVLGRPLFPGYWDGAGTSLTACFGQPAVRDQFLQTLVLALGAHVFTVLLSFLVLPRLVLLRATRPPAELSAAPWVPALLPAVYWAMYLSAPLTALHLQFAFRHSLPGIAASLIAVALIPGVRPAQGTVCRAVLAAGLLTGLCSSSPGGPLSTGVSLALVAGLGLLPLLASARLRALRVPVLVLASLAGIAVFTGYRERTRHAVYLAAYRRGHMRDVSTYLEQNARGRTVAYAGFATSYFLCGLNLQNRVRYVNLNACRTCRFHDYPDGKHRANPSYANWLENLKSAGVGFVVTGYHDLPAFSIEERWAAEHPADFTPRVRTARLNLYELTSAGQ